MFCGEIMEELSVHTLLISIITTIILLPDFANSNIFTAASSGGVTGG